MLASVRVRVTHLLLRVLSRARERSLSRSAFWHASVSRVSREVCYLSRERYCSVWNKILETYMHCVVHVHVHVWRIGG